MNDTITDSGQLGCIVSWEVPTTVRLNTLRAALTMAGLDQALAGELAPRHALGRALKHMEGERIIRRLRKTEFGLTFQLNMIVESCGSVQYPHETDVLLTNAGVIECSDYGILCKARELLNDALDIRITNDLSRLVQRIFDMNRADLIPIRKQGGAYFVPNSHAALVDSVRDLLNGIGGKMLSFAVKLGSGETSRSVADSLSEYLLNAIQELRTNVAALDNPSLGTLDRRANSICELKLKLGNYHGLLLGLAESVQHELDAAQTELLDRVVKLQQEKSIVNA